MDLHVQVTFSTRDKRYSVPEHPISIPRSSTCDDLQNILRELLESRGDTVSFDFLINNEFVEGTLDEFLKKKSLTLEVISIEFTVRQEAPEAIQSINFDDYVSCVKRSEKLILVGDYCGNVQLHTVKSADPLLTITLEEKVKCLEWIKKGSKASDDSIFVTGDFNQNIRLWVLNIEKNSLVCAAICKGHSNTVMSLASTSSIPGCQANVFASGSSDNKIKIWSASPDKSDLSLETGGISHVPKSEEKIPVRIPRLTLAGHNAMVTQVCWYNEGGAGAISTAAAPRLLSCSWDQSLRLWDVDAKCDGGNDKDVAAAPKCGEARRVVVGSALNDLSASPQGILVAACDNKVRIYDLRAKDALAQVGFQSHSGWLTSVAWAPHRSDQFVTGSIDKTVKLWDTRRISAPLYDLMGHQDMVTCVNWAQPDEDGQHYIVSSSADAKMPLILLCGYPCSGKTTITEKLVEMLREGSPECDIEIVSEQAIAQANQAYKGEEGKDPREAIFKNTASEKQLRAQIKSDTERVLSKKKGASTGVVIVDGTNFIKALRYDTFCIAKSLGQKQAVIHCTTPENMCREINTKMLAGTILFTKSSKTKVKQNKTTVISRSVAPDYIQLVEKATNKVINLILEAQSKGEEKMCLPKQEDICLQLASNIHPWTRSTLAKAKRNFLAFLRSGQRATKVNEDEMCVLFVGFLNNESQRDAFLA
nr:ribosome biogenesis protein wdr12 [Hymenolepis microstoma]